MAKLGRIAQRTKNKIMDAALSLFNEFGYDNVTIDAITQKAGVAKGTFYIYFNMKSDIIVEEFWKIDEYYESYSSKNLCKYKTAQGRLLAFTRAQMKYVRDVVGNTNLKICYANQAGAGSGKMLTNTERHWHTIIKGIMQKGQANGEFRTDLDADRLTVLFNRSARGVFLDWCVQDAAFDLVREGVAVMKDFIISAVQNVPNKITDK